MRHDEFKKRLGQEIKQLRAEENESQVQFAKRIGISQPHLSKIESGLAEPSLYSLSKLPKGSLIVSLGNFVVI